MLPALTFGDLVLDVVARVEPDLEADTDTPGEVRSAPGGSAANFAAWTARLGGGSRFVSRVGDDMLGRALVADLRQEGVEAHAVYDPVRPTAVLVLFAEGSQRHMLVPHGASHLLDEQDFPWELLKRSGWLHVTGYSFFWEGPRRVAVRAIAAARMLGIPISLDPSSAGFIRQQGLALPEGISLLLPNRDEAGILTGANTPEAAARRLGEHVPLVAVKLGAKGALVCDRGRVSHLPVETPAEPVLDTTGAGDAWAAAFVLSLRSGSSPAAAAEAANRLASRVVTRFGARPHLGLEGLRIVSDGEGP